MATVGIDPHKHVHVAVAVGADGRRVSRPLTSSWDASARTCPKHPALPAERADPATS